MTNAPSTPLHLVRFALSTPKLFELASRRRLPKATTDLGYLVHCQLAELFGELAPKPFQVIEAGPRRRTSTGRGRWTEVLGYSQSDEHQLRNRAQLFADPADLKACDWDQLAGKEMPASWRPGQRLGFEVRVCPVIRVHAEVPDRRKQGRELDAFTARCWAVGDRSIPVDRAEVYREWLTGRLAGAGVELLDVALERFRLTALLRRTQADPVAREAIERDKPDATLAGHLEVTDADAFNRLLARGVGRHRTFGFGMLLLRPPRR